MFHRPSWVGNRCNFCRKVLAVALFQVRVLFTTWTAGKEMIEKQPNTRSSRRPGDDTVSPPPRSVRTEVLGLRSLGRPSEIRVHTITTTSQASREGGRAGGGGEGGRSGTPSGTRAVPEGGLRNTVFYIDCAPPALRNTGCSGGPPGVPEGVPEKLRWQSIGRGFGQLPEQGGIGRRARWPSPAPGLKNHLIFNLRCQLFAYATCLSPYSHNHFRESRTWKLSLAMNLEICET